jgi:hypothetical protein
MRLRYPLTALKWAHRRCKQQTVFDVVEDGTVDALILPLRHVPIKVFRQGEIPKPSHRSGYVIDALHRLEHVVIVLRADRGSRAREQ